MRIAARYKLGFYPLPLPEAERIRRFLVFPDKQCCALDPCVGDGAAFVEITYHKGVFRYGVELDAGRAEQTRAKGIDAIHGNSFDVQCPVESFSLIYLNPPYDFEISEERSQRMERLFLEHVYRWLKPLGVLVMVIPAKRIPDCAVVLSSISATSVFIASRNQRASNTSRSLSSECDVHARNESECRTVRSRGAALASLARQKIARTPAAARRAGAYICCTSWHTRAPGASRAAPGRNRGLTPEIICLPPSLSSDFRAAVRCRRPPADSFAWWSCRFALHGRNAQRHFR